jgi:outer membrane protein X
MKKLIASALLAVSAATASAQIQTIDFKSSVRDYFGLGVGITADLTDNIEFSPSASYYFVGSSITNLQAEADFHYKFDVGDEFTVYPLLGAGLNYDNTTDSHSDLNFLMNLGCGLKKDFSSSLAGFVECKYQWIGGHGHDGAYLTAGVKLAL